MQQTNRKLPMDDFYQTPAGWVQKKSPGMFERIMFRDLFVIQEVAYIRATEGGTITEKKPIGNMIKDHIEGVSRTGAFPGLKDLAKWAVVDVDNKENDGEAKSVVDRIVVALLNHNIFYHIEKSKSKGYHIWIFFDEPAIAREVRLALFHIVREAGFDPEKDVEVFPKQDALKEGDLGNAVFLPMHGESIKEGRTLFLNNQYEPYPDQWDYLKKIHKTKAETITKIVEDEGLEGKRMEEVFRVEDPSINEPFAEKGNRDKDTFHTLNTLAKLGESDPVLRKAATILAEHCDPPFSEREAQTKVDSAVKREERKTHELSDRVKGWIEFSYGEFSVQQIYSDLGVTTPREKDLIRKNLSNLTKKGILKRGRTEGKYRRVDETSKKLEILNEPPIPLDIKFPCGIHEYVKIFPKSIIVVAGASNAGKTGYDLNIACLNRNTFPVTYFTSEMENEELTERIRLFEDVPLDEWRKIDFENKVQNIADAIRPDGLNIIDYLEVVDGEFYKIGQYIRDIYDALDKGVAIITLQMNSGAALAQGGEQTIAKARLYLTVDRHRLTVKKAKNRRDGLTNPNDMYREFKLVKGCLFVWEGGWKR